MAKRSNKTSHVMNLIAHRTSPSAFSTNEDGSISYPENAESEASSAFPRESDGTVKNRLDRTMSDNDPAAEALHNALVNQLFHDHGPLTDAPEPKSSVASSQPDFSAAEQGNAAVPHPVTPKLENIAEEAVLKKLPEMMQRFSMCTCEVCTTDVIALTLNHLPPQYVVSMRGKLYARIHAGRPQTQQEIDTALAEACKKVSENPRHEMQEK